MPTAKAELEALQAEHFADDILITDEMQQWSPEEAAAFFASGGADRPVPAAAVAAAPPVPPPPPPPPSSALDPALLKLIQQPGRTFDCAHLSRVLAGETLASISSHERPALLTRLKQLGVTSLPQRQALATSIVKAAKASTGLLVK